MTDSPVVNAIENGYEVIVNHSYFFLFRKDEKGLLIETSSGCYGERDEQMMRAMRPRAVAALPEAVRVTKTLIADMASA